jgi:hypothetical protein
MGIQIFCDRCHKDVTEQFREYYSKPWAKQMGERLLYRIMFTEQFGCEDCAPKMYRKEFDVIDS